MAQEKVQQDEPRSFPLAHRSWLWCCGSAPSEVTTFKSSIVTRFVALTHSRTSWRLGSVHLALTWLCFCENSNCSCSVGRFGSTLTADAARGSGSCPSSVAATEPAFLSDFLYLSRSSFLRFCFALYRARRFRIFFFIPAIRWNPKSNSMFSFISCFRKDPHSDRLGMVRRPRRLALVDTSLSKSFFLRRNPGMTREAMMSVSKVASTSSATEVPNELASMLYWNFPTSPVTTLMRRTPYPLRTITTVLRASRAIVSLCSFTMLTMVWLM
mmetsp:Transcript_40672/g.77636  ORF Transcript_40672/g.77636 Transcript_40672/m.77636 type:complete len:270 (-) Transcript_40672:699-1508(-)